MRRSCQEIQKDLDSPRLKTTSKHFVDLSSKDSEYAKLKQELKDAQKREKEGATGGVIVAPQDCKVMVGFNMDSAGKEAKQLTQFLNNSRVATFSTCVYCPENPGTDWKETTNTGIVQAKVLVVLVTKGWMESVECRKETTSFIQRMKIHKDKILIIVNMPGITPADYDDPKCALFNEHFTTQNVDGTKPEWMEAVLKGVRVAIQ